MSKLASLIVVPLTIAFLSCTSSSDPEVPNEQQDAAVETDAGGAGQADGGVTPDAEAGTATGGTGGSAGMGGAGGSAGTGGAGGSAGTGGSGGTADGWVSPECIKPGATEEACNPVTNYLCTTEQACDFIIGEDFAVGFACAHIQDTDGNEGDPCDNSEGPFCLAGMHCAKTGNTQACVYMCCSDADCTGIAKTCEPLDQNKVGTFGFCR